MDGTRSDPARDRAPNAPASPPDPEYGDLLLVDILRPDWRNFFSRYRTDLAGFAVVTIIIVFIIVATKWLAMIGADAAAGR